MVRRAHLILTSLIFFTNATFADEEKKKTEWHCEKKSADGDVEDLGAKSKEECKKKGGKWSKEHSHDHQEENKDHSKDDGHGHK